MFEIVEVELPFPSFINNSQHTSNFFSRKLLAAISNKSDHIFPSDEIAIGAEHLEDTVGVEIEGTE